MEGEDDVVRHIGHAEPSVRPCADGVVQLGAVVNIGSCGAIVGTFVINFNLSNGLSARGYGKRGEALAHIFRNC